MLDTTLVYMRANSEQTRTGAHNPAESTVTKVAGIFSAFTAILVGCIGVCAQKAESPGRPQAQTTSRLGTGQD